MSSCLAQTSHAPSLMNSPANAEWIVGRVETLLSHYFHPDVPDDVWRGALMDWLEILDGLSETAINTACHGYLREQPRRRPTPGDIYTRALACSMQGGPLDEGQRAAMPRDYEDNLETCLARARRWVTMGGSMAEHGHRFLAHWGASDR